jgi:hypothetical protein
MKFFLFLVLPAATLLVSIFSASIVYAQVAARVNGSVQDPSGAAVPNAVIGLQLPGGNASLYSTTTGVEGTFSFSNVNTNAYVLVVSAQGFETVLLNGVEANIGRSTDVPVIKLVVPAQGQTIDVVSESPDIVQVSNAEVTSTLTNEQLQSLPILDRSPLGFLETQPGINNNARGSSTVNGLRVSFTNVTMDGINIQDNLIRTNDLDYLPNMLLLDQVAEVTVATSNANMAAYGGAGQVAFVTPSGTNSLHGKIYWSNQNSALAANTYFNNQSGTKNPFLNQNQPGVAIGGHVIRNKLFYYTNYEAYRNHQQTSQDATVLTSAARSGLFTYTDSGGAVRQVNLLTTAGVAPDPAMTALINQEPAATAINNFNVGDSSAALLRNTAGYQFVKQDNETRDNVTFRTDYVPNTKNSFSVTDLWNRDILDRPDLDTTFSAVPTVANHNNTKLLSSSWRWSPKPALTNEVLFGFNLAPVSFLADQNIPTFFVTGMNFTDPENTFLTQGRNTDTWNFADNGTWVHGRHIVQFGFQYQDTSIKVYNYAGITPTYTLGIGTGNTGLSAAQLPGISSNDLADANALLATLAGYYTSSAQTFNVTSRSSGYVPGQAAVNNYALKNYAFYSGDNWRISGRLTAMAGLRWDYQTPVNETDGLALLPVLVNNNIDQTLLSNATLGFAGGNTGRSWYKADKNNFAPNVGLAWNVFGDGRTAIRAGYSINYVNDEVVSATINSVNTNKGLGASTVTTSGLSGSIGSGVTPIVAPVFQIPRTFADNVASFGLSNAEAAIDPGLVTPYVQQWNVGIEHAVKSMVFAVRYVGNHGTKLLRAIDLNQVIISGILPDFKNAQNNGFLAQKATGSFNPTYNPAIAGSVPLPYFGNLAGGGLLTNSTVDGYIQTGQVGELANAYYVNNLMGTAAPVYESAYGQGMNLMTNYSNSTYNGLQLEANRQFGHGLQFQSNFTWSKALSDTALSNATGSTQTNFEPFLDNANPGLERAPDGNTNVPKAFKANASYRLPFGPGHSIRTNVALLDHVIEGWRVAGIFGAQTGAPFSITSGSLGTFNRAARSTNNEADTTLSGSELQDLMGFYQTPAGPYFIAPSAIGPDGRGVAGAGDTPFAGQAFFNPGAGTVGTLQRNYFTGPAIRSLDMSASKILKIGERVSAELRVDAENVFNHPTFVVGDQNINSTTFGKITSTGTALSQARRLLTIGLVIGF